MARVTHVKRAQQRFETKPVLGRDGQPVQVPVMRRDGTQKVTKRGKPVFMRRTVEDRSKPKPLLTCDYCHKPIEIGTPYKHITPKSGPYGGYQRNRHESCPTWQVWDYSSSLSAQVAQIEHDFNEGLAGVNDEDDVQSLLDDAAQAVRDIAEEKRQSAQNIEEGFGHETSTSQDLSDVADQLDSWADEIESATIPDRPEHEPEDPEDDEGDELTDDELQEWRDEVANTVTIVGECPC